MNRREWLFKGLYGVVASVLILISLSTAPASSQDSPSNGCREYLLEVPDGDATRQIHVTAGAETFWTWTSIDSIGALYGGGVDLHLAVKVVGKPLILGRYVKLGGKTVEIGFSSSDPKILNPAGSGRFVVKGVGKAVLRVAIGQAQVDVPVTVVRLPIAHRMPAEKIIGVMGLPDAETREYIPWPESKILDGIFYTNESDGKGRRVQHWLYDAYPGLVLALENGVVSALYNRTWYAVWAQWLQQNN